MRGAALPVLLALSVLAACGSEDETTPVACLNGPAAFTQALQSAPGQVRLTDGVPISNCLTENQSGGDLAEVGGALVEVATKLNLAARQDPGGPATVELGYLVGAAQRGSEDTSGIHSELVRRLEAAALFGPAGKPPPPPFDQAYQRGYAEGRGDG
ncbi:MAG: hypothetical protein AABM29_09380 [Actinomycetota bacterium]